MIKLSVNETKWSSLLARTRALLLCISIWTFDFGPEKLPGRSRNGPLVTKSLKVGLKVPELQKCQIVTKVPLSGYISAPLLQKFAMNVTKVPYQCYESSRNYESPLFLLQKCPFSVTKVPVLLALSLSLCLSFFLSCVSVPVPCVPGVPSVLASSHTFLVYFYLFTRMYSCVTGMHSYVTRMLPVCTHMYLYVIGVTRMYSCGVLVTIATEPFKPPPC